ncbi:copper chaperone PCu(A)C [Flavobacterium sp. MXW15]|uniref:Copper chaperone PCu(A)C n=1 Tax=Xanthomonas chitinilytica TaxID=2989819 RepID=A0ABT3JVH0_9XANT|nr:copper chaperone PCu(A)C [Xanthomonas sp. H13-6]MCW4454887.1 copper chaperone PCu(A)C [Flavobacterium sp. MXW15]MCW4472485.1 copper chaperone PCu(A)C [Xanthomonas sp. H13-6]
MIAKPFVCVLWALGALAAPASAAEAAEASCLALHEGWVRLPPAPAMAMMAGFGRMQNGCAAPVAVVAAASPAFAAVSLHETTLDDGVSRMREVERLAIDPGRSALLQPGGLHLMLMRPQQELVEGATVPLRLELEDGRQVDVRLVVRRTPPSAADAHAGHAH